MNSLYVLKYVDSPAVEWHFTDEIGRQGLPIPTFSSSSTVTLLWNILIKFEMLSCKFPIHIGLK
jgi:hypothetical protein